MIDAHPQPQPIYLSLAPSMRIYRRKYANEVDVIWANDLAFRERWACAAAAAACAQAFFNEMVGK